jgi:hypothetical protein
VVCEELSRPSMAISRLRRETASRTEARIGSIVALSSEAGMNRPPTFPIRNPGNASASSTVATSSISPMPPPQRRGRQS